MRAGAMKHLACCLAFCGVVGSAAAQEWPVPTVAGRVALGNLLAQCITAGGLAAVRDEASGNVTLSVVDAAKLKEIVAAARPADPAALRDALVARWNFVKGEEAVAVMVLLRALGESAGDERAVAFADSFDGLGRQGSDPAGARERLGRAVAAFGRCEERGWQAACLNGIGMIDYGQGRYREALSIYGEALAIRLEALGGRHPDVAQSYNNIAAAHGALGEPAKALEYHQKALAIRLEALGGRHPDVALSYNNIALAHGALGEPAKALEYHQKALAIWLEALGGRHPDVALSYNNITLAHGALGEPAKALEYHQKALAILLEALGGRHPDVATSYNNIAEAHGALGEPAKALEYHQKALAIRLEALGGRHPDVATSYNNIAEAHGALGEPAKALEYHQKALAIRLEALGGRHPDVAQSYNNIAAAHGALGEPAKALEYHQKALAIRLEALGGRHPDVALSYNNIAAVHYALGEPAKALEYFEKALAIWLEALGGRHPDVALSYNNIALAHGALGEPAKALEYHQKALAILLEALGGRHPDVATSYNNIALAHGALGEPAKALEYHQKALAIRLEALGGRHPDVATSYNNIAEAHGALGEPAKALEYHQKALAIRLEALGGRHPDVALSYNNIAAAHDALGEPAKALEAFDRAVDALAEPGAADGAYPTAGLVRLRPLPENIQVLANRALLRCAGAEHRPDDDRAALADLMAASELLDRLRRPDSAPGRTEATSADRLHHGEEAADLAPLTVGVAARLADAEGNPARRELALDAAERGTARVFLDALGRSRSAITGRVDPGLLDEEARLRRRLADADLALAREQDRPAARRDGDRVKQLLKASHAAEAALREHVARLERDYPQYAALKYPRPCTFDQARAALAADEVALTFVPGTLASYLVVLRGGAAPEGRRLEVHALPREDELAELAASLTEAKALDDAMIARERGAEAYRALLAPAAEAIRGKSLVIVPGGALGRLPFELLVEPGPGGDGNGGEGRFLAQGHRIRYAPSLTALHLLGLWEAARTAPDRPLWALGDPDYGDPAQGPSAVVAARSRGVRGGRFERLPGTAAEVRAIAERLGVPPETLLLGRDASETAVKRASGDGSLARARHVHFACHGVLGGGDGLMPGLVLAQVGNPEDEDGFLRLDEVANLKLNADLVVLSACQTGEGRAFRAEGVSSLARAFFFAGTRGVVASLWKVDDAATAKLMAALYDGLASGHPAADALRTAKLRLLADGHPPAHWAAFVYLGR